MTVVQKISAVLVGVVFCFFSFQIVHAEVFVPTTCECRITCDLSRVPPNPLSPGSAIRRVGSGLTTQGFLDVMNTGIDEACSNFFSISESEAERLRSEVGLGGLVWQAFTAAFGGGATTQSSRQTLAYFSASTIGREINSEYVLGSGCSSAGQALSKTYSCTNETTGLSTDCFCLPNEVGDDCFVSNPKVTLSCERKNDRGLNQQEFAQSLAAISGTPEQTQTTDARDERDYGPGYEPIAWSFPTDKINSLNKVGISGTGTTQVQMLIGRLIKYAVGFLGALALCLVIYSGLRFMLSQGDEGKQGEALKMMLWAGIGIVALLGSYSIVTFVLGILK